MHKLDLTTNIILYKFDKNSTLFFFFSTLFEILPWENGFQLWVGCFPGSRSLKATSETSGLFSFKSLENSQRTAGNHLSTAIIRVNLEKKKNRLLFLIKGPFSTVYIATRNFCFPTHNFCFPTRNFHFLTVKKILIFFTVRKSEVTSRKTEVASSCNYSRKWSFY